MVSNPNNNFKIIRIDFKVSLKILIKKLQKKFPLIKKPLKLSFNLNKPYTLLDTKVILHEIKMNINIHVSKIIKLPQKKNFKR